MTDATGDAAQTSQAESPDRLVLAFSLALTVVGCALIIALGLRRYSFDGSFWIDEATVAISIREMGFTEFFGPLRHQISFPRWYLLVYKALNELVGYETWVLRLPSISCFVVGSILWFRLFYLRFRATPLLIVIAIALSCFPSTWFVYSSLVKQYTFDVLLAVGLFSIPDATFERMTRRGERRWRLLLLALPCALSYTYVFALAGRCGGWLFGEIAARRRSFDRGALLTFVAGVLFFSTSLYVTDVRHTVTVESLDAYWRICMLTGDGADVPAILDEMFFGWYTGRTISNDSPGLNALMLNVLRALTALGALRMLFLLASAWRRGAAGKAIWSPVWGTRSLGALLCLVALLAGGLVLDYPLCATRLILFSVFCMQLMTLEGAYAVFAIARRIPRGKVVANLILLAIVIGLAPDAGRDYAMHYRSRPPQNIRPLLERIRKHPKSSLPIMVDACTIRQIRTLPEGIGDSELIYYLRVRDLKRIEDYVPWGREAWVINTQIPCTPYRDPFRGLRNSAVRWKRLSQPPDTAILYWVEFKPEPAPTAPRPAEPDDVSARAPSARAGLGPRSR